MTIPTSPVVNAEEHRTLSVGWDMKEDQLIFDITHLANIATKLEPKKKNITSVIGQIYDPLGYLTPALRS